MRRAREGQNLLDELGGVARPKGRVLAGGRGLRTCGGGTKRLALDPRGQRRESWMPARGSVAAQAGRCRAAARDWGNGTSAAQLLASRRGVLCVRGQPRAGYLRPGEGGCQPASAGAVGGSGPGSRGVRLGEETRLSGGLELGRAGTEHFKRAVKCLCVRFASEQPGKHDSGSRPIVF